MIPFKYGIVVAEDDFCGRKELIKQLGSLIASSQNTLIIGERRIGKTSLIYETVRRHKKIKPVFIDLLEIKTLYDLTKRIINAILSMEKESSLINRTLESLKSLRPKIGIDPVSNLPTVSLDPSVKLPPDSLEAVLDLIKDLRKKWEMVIIFDEFQDILNLKNAREVIPIMRSKIQYQKNITYIFAGSIRNQMENIFLKSDSPMFKSAIPINVGPIHEMEFSKFIKKKFLIGKRTIDDSVISKIFEMTDHVSGDIQQLCEALWSVTSSGGHIRDKDIDAAIKLIFSREEKSYQQLLTELTAIQQQCLTGLARIGGKNISSSHFLKETGIKQPSSAAKAVEKLIRAQIIFKIQNEYRFVNPFFREWLVYKDI